MAVGRTRKESSCTFADDAAVNACTCKYVNARTCEYVNARTCEYVNDVQLNAAVHLDSLSTTLTSSVPPLAKSQQGSDLNGVALGDAVNLAEANARCLIQMDAFGPRMSCSLAKCSYC